MKKMISLLLCLILLVSTGLIAAAAPAASDVTMDNRLKAITLSVKNTLGIGDDFTVFNGTLNEYAAASLWSLNWSKDDEQIYVSANENGRIVSYQHFVSNSDRPYRGNIPRFPKIDIDEAKSLAAAFLDRVLDKNLESVELQGNSQLDYSGSAVFYLNGTVKLYGTETPVYVSLNVNSATKEVTSFNRSDAGQDYSGVTKPSAATDKAAAAAALKGTLNMKMIYALPGDGTHTARLQFQPNPDGSYVVDAATGQLLDLSKLDYSDRMDELSKDSAAAPSASSDSGGLTAVEQATVDKLQGVLSQSELEQLIRAYAELGLTSDFILRYLNYYTYEDENKQTQVTATMEFTYNQKDAPSQYRYITMDAKTGKLISLSSNRPYRDMSAQAVTYKYTDEQTLAIARVFAGKILPDELKQTTLSEEASAASSESTRYYAFLRTHDGIFFPENSINVGVDAETGFIVSFNSNWHTFDVTFVSSAGAISAAAAADTYSSAVGTVLRYVSVPTSTHASGLLLSYLGADTTVWGVNAVTGEVLKFETMEDDKLEYSDIDGNPYAAIIRKLAAYGVGFSSGAFKPDAQLTQEDALALIVSASGRKAIPLTSPASLDDLYAIAHSMGILTPAEKDPPKLISRAEFVKYLVNALGYGEVAGLPGIFRAGFNDDKTIPAALMGYVAIGKGIGIIRGDQNGNFMPNNISTRVMAAIMLYNCMSRK